MPYQNPRKVYTKKSPKKASAEREGEGVWTSPLYSMKMISVFSIINCTARFLACMSVISRSRLWSRMMVGAKTTERFLGDIYLGVSNAILQLER